MVLLAIDTSGANCSAGLYNTQDETCILSCSKPMERGHAEYLVIQVQRLLDESGCNFNEIMRIAVTIGPGSFSGLRVGLAAAKGFSLACDAQLVGISTFDAFRYIVNVPATIIMDGRRGEVFYQTTNGCPQHRILKDLQLTELDVLDNQNFLAGPLAKQIAEQMEIPEQRVIQTMSTPQIDAVGHLGLKANCKTHPAKLNYLRGADASKGKGFSVARV